MWYSSKDRAKSGRSPTATARARPLKQNLYASDWTEQRRCGTLEAWSTCTGFDHMKVALSWIHFEIFVSFQTPTTIRSNQTINTSPPTTTTMDTCRNQIIANLSVVRPPLARDGYDFEVITSRTVSNCYYAWVFVTAEPPLPILKGPVASSSKKAVEELLDITAGLVTLACEKVVQDFEGQLSHQVGDGAFVLESAMAEPKADET